MSRRVVTLRPETSLNDAIEKLVRHGFSGAPVVTATQRVVGVLSEFDCMKLVATRSFHEGLSVGGISVGDVMSELKAEIRPDTDLFTIVHRFLTWEVRRLPVIEGGKLVGLVSRRDVLRAIHRLQGEG